MTIIKKEANDVARAIETLTGEETLIACWSALAGLSPNARVTRSPTATVAVFPSWTPMNNAIVADNHDAVATASELRGVYANAGVGVWALWLPSAARDFDAADEIHEVGTLERDTTTLVMRAVLSQHSRLHEGVARISLSALDRIANDEPVPVNELGEPELVPGLSMWAMIRDDVAVACVYTFIHGDDCGVYAVATLPAWRRRGFARSLLEHVLTDAAQRGARTASLQSTRIGQPLYLSLGFEPVGRYEEWISK
jgi:ribosomal protein S18 acetylase RimI-like enzyme